jgi:hypothetical protein
MCAAAATAHGRARLRCVRVYNAKISFRLTNPSAIERVRSTWTLSCKLEQVTVIPCSNSRFVKARGFSAQLFPSGAVNLTGIPGPLLVPAYLDRFVHLFDLSPSDVGVVKIDNLTASGSVVGCPLPVDFDGLLRGAPTLPGDMSLRYNPQSFHAMYLRSLQESGVVILFRTGKFVVVGAKSVRGVRAVCRSVLLCVFENAAAGPRIRPLPPPRAPMRGGPARGQTNLQRLRRRDLPPPAPSVR